MANTYLTSTEILYEAQRILHQRLVFIKSINRQYDSHFGKAGKKIGDTLGIRMPIEPTVRSGMTRSNQDVTDTKVDLVMSTVKGVDLNFPSMDLTLKIDDFSNRYIKPSMARLASALENDACSMWRDVYNVYDNNGVAASFNTVMESGKILTDNLTPEDAERTLILNTRDNADIVKDMKGLFNTTGKIGDQNDSGIMREAGGFMFKQSTITGGHTSGTAVAVTGYLMNGATTTGASALVVDTGTTTFAAGDVITIAGVFPGAPQTRLQS